MIDMDALFSAAAGCGNGPEIPPTGTPGQPALAGLETHPGGSSRPHAREPAKPVETVRLPQSSAIPGGGEPGNFGTAGTATGPTQTASAVPNKTLFNNELDTPGPLGPLGPRNFSGDGIENGNRAPGGGAARNQFALHPSAVILLIAYCRRLDIPPFEQAEALAELGYLPPGEQVRRWQAACMGKGIEPWKVLSIEAPTEGHDCSLCAHLLTRQYAGDGGRRQFHWACGKGYLILETGRGTERIWIAPPECQSWERWYPSDKR